MAASRRRSWAWATRRCIRRRRRWRTCSSPCRGIGGMASRGRDSFSPRPCTRGRGEQHDGAFMNTHFSFQRLVSVARKESLHILRDPGTLFFALFIPVIELFMLGYAIDTNVRDVSTVVLDMCKTTESRALIRRFETSTSFRVLPERIYTDVELTQAIVAGRAHVGIKI